MPALPTLLHGLIDYAGLFPPAKLPMADAVGHYANHRRGLHAAMLGRFILPLTLLAEFENEHSRLTSEARAGWQLSVLAGHDPAADLAAIRDFNSRQTAARIVSLETKAGTPADVARLTAPFPADFSIWVEIPAVADPGAHLAAVKAAGRGAKIRTGGVTPEVFPSPAAVTRFMLACREAGLPFKATAGLHHPLRGEFALTYEPGSPTATMFGFLNIFLAAALIHGGGGEAEAIALLGETDPGVFAVAPDAITWRSHRFTTAAIASARQDFSRSFGSCSFAEPIEGLLALRWL